MRKGETDSLLAEFDDSVQAAVWARESIAVCVKSGIIVGKSGKKIMPKDEITRAEVTSSVRRLLQNSNLI